MESKARNSRERWGMEFLLVFFPEHDIPIIPMNLKTQTSPSPAPPTRLPNLLRRANSSKLLNKAQSTIYICALLIFLSLLLFTLCTFDPPSHTSVAGAASRRRLYSSNLQIPNKSTQFHIFPFNFRKPNSKSNPKPINSRHALQGMGKLHRRGTRAMTDLLVAHVTESVTSQELRLFLRTLHRSGLTSKADIVLIFNPLSSSSSSSLESVVMEENDSFSKLVTRDKLNSFSGLDRTQFIKSVKNGKEWGEPIWGGRIRSNYSREGGNESTRLSYGSVVSFTADELDPENSLAGFLDHVPMSLRRWATYPMLLGRLRRKFKHTALVDIREILIIADPLGRVRTQSPESVLLFTESEQTTSKHGRKYSAKTQPRVIPGLIIGGERGVRRFSAAMLTEIVRVTTGSRKKKNSVTETGVFEQLVRNEHLMKITDVVSWTESIADVSSLNSNSDSSSNVPPLKHRVTIRGNSDSEVMTSALLKQICQQESDPTVYSEC